jgi:hypothetical protein
MRRAAAAQTSADVFRKKNAGQKNKRCSFSVRHFSVWRLLVAETAIGAQGADFNH